ncbi:MAG: hypothetical protein J0653_05270, partial [Deltaproteobacteria bacterium]|nr:hypothetical protein [Deltaproteobacteria bacterium]
MGSYPVGQQVSLSCSGGCDGTYYCLGEGCTNYTAYTGPITLTESTVLRFYSTSIFTPENVHSYSYILDPTLAYRFEQLWPKPDQPQYFDRPQGVAVDSSGNLYVADTQKHRIQKFNSAGGYISAWGGLGFATGQFMYPVGVAVDTSGNVTSSNSCVTFS